MKFTIAIYKLALVIFRTISRNLVGRLLYILLIIRENFLHIRHIFGSTFNRFWVVF